MRNWSTFGAQMSHEHTRIYKTHHDPNLKEVTTFPFIIFSVISHGGYIQTSFCHVTPKLGVPKFPKLGLLTLWKVITSCVNFWFRWGLKQSDNPCWDLFKDMWHATCMHLFQGDFTLLVSESQIGTLTIGPSFGHNLYFKYSNGHVSPFQTYKFQELSNGIKNSLIQWVLNLKIFLWKFETP
jgi:hypothetical protein